MIELIAEIRSHVGEANAFAVSTVVKTWNSAPRPDGSSMMVTSDDEVIGSVSDGCVEGALYDVAKSVLTDGNSVYSVYGVSDDEAFAVGLTCGGTIEVFTERIQMDDEWVSELLRNHGKSEGFAVATVVRGDAWVGTHLVISSIGFIGSIGSIGSERLDRTIFDDALGLLTSGTSGLLRYGIDGQRLEIAAALARLGKFLGYHVTVCDARSIFAARKRFVDADADYVGAMGSRRTHDDQWPDFARKG